MLRHRRWDKVRVKKACKQWACKRGVVECIKRGKLRLRLSQGLLITVPEGDVTNLSLAARSAWRHMPKRGVGRPRGSKVSDRISVTFRIDRELWEALKLAEARSLITDRTAFINAVLRDHLGTLNQNWTAKPVGRTTQVSARTLLM